ncbi:MAG: HlyC/CorC family transporter [Erysipelotrichaceae bacterium]|nr:HlyC/CorC family transporter [Erysipelotrichaceae bacterium]
MDNSTIIIILIVLILFSAFFSASETAFSSLNKIRLKYLANNGNRKAQKTLDLAEDFNSLLSTILIGNNLVNILSSSLATVLFVSFFRDNGVAVSTIVMTVVVLIFGEITPKTLAKAQPEKFAIAVTGIMSLLITVLKPLSYLFNGIGSLVSKIFKTEDSDEFRSEEFITMVEEAQEDGDMDEDDADLITNAIEFNDQDVGKVFTPRVDVIAAELDDSLEEVDKLFRESGYSRLPVYEDSLDDIIGVLHEKDFYYVYYKDAATDLKQLLQKPVYTSEHVKISALLKQLQQAKAHMAVVLDEYGGTAGIITMEDILEEIVGEIYDEHDEIVEYFTKIDDHNYIVNCDADVEDMFEYFDITMEDEYDFNTVSGWVIHMMDKIPVNGDSFVYNKFRVTVTDADEKTVNEIKIEVIDEEEEEKED